jgi:hypothetical protein
MSNRTVLCDAVPKESWYFKILFMTKEYHMVGMMTMMTDLMTQAEADCILESGIM